MLIQWYKFDETARIFEHDNSMMLCEFPYVKSVDVLNNKILQLGVRRRGKWQKTEWGYEAKLRKK